MISPLTFSTKWTAALRLLLFGLLQAVAVSALAQPTGCSGTDAGGRPAGSGLYAEYYTGYAADSPASFTDNSRPAGLAVTEGQVNFPGAGAWRSLAGVAGGGTATNADDFSLRLRGSLYIPVTGLYTLYLTSDDASWLWLDGAARALPATAATATINNGGTHPLQVRTATVVLSQGLHSLLIHYGEASGDNALVLEYESLTAGIGRQVVPASAFCTSLQGSTGPLALSFAPALYTGPTGTALSSAPPTVVAGGAALTGFAAVGPLPAGFTLDPATGVFTAAASVPPGTYRLDLAVSNSNATSTFYQVVTFQINGSPPPGCTGTDPGGNPANSGLYAEYFSGYYNDDPAFFGAVPVGLRRIEAQVNFGTGGFGNLLPVALGSLLNPDNFSLQLRGSLRIAVAGTYTFYLTSDDASLLWLDNAALASPTVAAAAINNGGLHGPRTLQASVYLVAGLHNLRLLYGEDLLDNVLRLEYEGPDAPTRQLVPASAFCTAAQPLRNLPASLQYTPASQTTVAGTAAVSGIPVVVSATTPQFVLANAASLPAGITLNATTGQLTVGAGVATGTYRADVAVLNADGAVTFRDAVTLVVAPLPPVSCTSSRPDGGAPTGGLYAEYYSGFFADDPTYFSTRLPGLVRVEGALNYSAAGAWSGLQAVAAGTPTNADSYSARYRGSLAVAAGGTYTFYLTSDDASRLWIGSAALLPVPLNSQALIDNGGNHPATTVSGSLVLQPGLYDLLVHYGEDAGDNVLQLEYEGPDAPTRQLIPATVLCSAGSGRPLPVALIRFEAQAGSQGVALRWATAQELNSAYYEVERSANGLVFEPVVRVAAAGTTSQRQQYAATDPAPLPGLSYYRLHQLDLDGQQAYSPVVAVTAAAPEKPRLQLSVAPNPSNGRFAVQLTQSQPGPGRLELLDLQGRVCYRALLSGKQATMDVDATSLPAGLYLLRATTAAAVATQKIVVR